MLLVETLIRNPFCIRIAVENLILRRNQFLTNAHFQIKSSFKIRVIFWLSLYEWIVWAYMEEGHLTAAQKLSHYRVAETSPFIILM